MGALVTPPVAAVVVGWSSLASGWPVEPASTEASAASRSHYRVPGEGVASHGHRASGQRRPAADRHDPRPARQDRDREGRRRRTGAAGRPPWSTVTYRPTSSTTVAAGRPCTPTPASPATPGRKSSPAPFP